MTRWKVESDGVEFNIPVDAEFTFSDAFVKLRSGPGSLTPWTISFDDLLERVDKIRQTQAHTAEFERLITFLLLLQLGDTADSVQ